MRIFKRLVAVAAFVGLLALSNLVLSFALIQYGSRVQATWSDYDADPDIDTILIGNSLVERGINPFVLDSKCGTNSCNLGTSQQELEESYLGIKSCVERDNVKTVILGVELSYFKNESYPNPASPFMYEKRQREGFSEGLIDAAYCLSQPGQLSATSSINWLFPWVEYHVKLNKKSIESNVDNRLSGESPQEVTSSLDKNFDWDGKGYGNTTIQYAFNDGSLVTYANYYKNANKPLNERKLCVLKDICALCKANGVDLIVTVSPIMPYNTIDYGSNYFETMDAVRDAVNEYGYRFFDFNMVKESHFSFDEKYYYDYQHLNREGAEAFSSVLAEVLLNEKQGIDSSDYFYSKEDFYLANSGILAASLKAKARDGKVIMDADVISGSELVAEYRYSYKKKGEKEWQLVSDYSGDKHIEVVVPEKGDYIVRVEVKQEGSDLDSEKYRTMGVKVK